MQVTIIGGGVVGLCCAYYLNKEGYEVTVIDRNDITDGCSFGNMGFISPSHFIPLASPGIVAEGFRYMFRSSSPFYIKPRLNWDLIQWALHFLKSSNAATVKRNAPHLNNILQLSRRLIGDLKNDLNGDIDFYDKGCLMMCRHATTLEHEFQIADHAEQYGLTVEKLYRPDVQRLESQVEV